MRFSKTILLAAAIGGCGEPPTAQTFETERVAVTASVLVDGLEHPWAMAFLPESTPDSLELLVTERSGRLRRVRDGRLEPRPIGGVPAVAVTGQGGLMDVALDPDFTSNRLVYLSYSAGEDGNAGTEVVRARLEDAALRDPERIFAVSPKSPGGRHFGSRLAFAADGTLYVSAGDRGERARAQDRRDAAGSIIRIHPDGSVPEDNPFVDDPRAAPELFSYGHRNPQGLAFHPATGELWSHEHGPRGGDEVNVVRAGGNYGWPEITYGREYATFRAIGEGTARADVVAPVHVWIPSIAPSGMAFYDGDRFPPWQGDLFVGSLKFAELVRLDLDENQVVVGEERLLEDAFGRIREVRAGPDGFIYLLTDDGDDGRLVRLAPASPDVPPVASE